MLAIGGDRSADSLIHLGSARDNCEDSLPNFAPVTDRRARRRRFQRLFASNPAGGYQGSCLHPLLAAARRRPTIASGS